MWDIAVLFALCAPVVLTPKGGYISHCHVFAYDLLVRVRDL